MSHHPERTARNVRPVNQPPSLYNVLDWRDYFNMNLPVERQVDNDGQTIIQGIQRPNGWPTRSKWNDRWLHSDMKDVPYFYNFKFYEKVVEKGELQ